MVDFSPYLGMIIPGVIIFVVVAIGGGIGYWFWIASRPPKMTWKAYVYQLGDGIIKRHVEAGKTVIRYTLKDLKPYTQDVVSKIDKKDGATHYWMSRLQKPVPVVTADCVEVWGQKEKVVRVLLEEDSCTLLKPAYDKKIGEMIFRPLPHDRVNMIKTELSERNARIENTKDILAAIFPYITVGISILGIVIFAYFIGQAGVKMAEANTQTAEINMGGQKELATMYINALAGDCTGLMPEIKKEPPPLIPP